MQVRPPTDATNSNGNATCAQPLRLFVADDCAHCQQSALPCHHHHTSRTDWPRSRRLILTKRLLVRRGACLEQEMATAALSALEKASRRSSHARSATRCGHRARTCVWQTVVAALPLPRDSVPSSIRMDCALGWHPRGDVQFDRERIHSTQLAGPQVHQQV
jgi:hypothetical protein